MMGNSVPRQSDKVSQPKPNLMKGYNCYMYVIASFPDSFVAEKCVVIDHDYHKTFYDLRLESDPTVVFNKIPYFYVSGRRDKRTWHDYFKVGTMVQTSVTDVHRKYKRRAEIMDVRTDYEYQVVVDLKDTVTNLTIFGVTPDKYLLDMKYYKDW
jgi:hypothetical protein